MLYLLKGLLPSISNVTKNSNFAESAIKCLIGPAVQLLGLWRVSAYFWDCINLLNSKYRAIYCRNKTAAHIGAQFGSCCCECCIFAGVCCVAKPGLENLNELSNSFAYWHNLGFALVDCPQLWFFRWHQIAPTLFLVCWSKKTNKV